MSWSGNKTVIVDTARMKLRQKPSVTEVNGDSVANASTERSFNMGHT